MWVDEKIPQRQERLTNYVKFVQGKVAEFIVNFPDMDSREATDSYINFANDLSSLNKDQDELVTLAQLRGTINDMNNSEELLKELIRQRNLHFKVANESFALPNFGSDFETDLKRVNYHIAHIKTLTRAIQILEGKTE